jgi:hypothetical protein
MLSKAEIEFLKNPRNFDANYSKSLRNRLNKKVKILQRELRLLEHAGFVGVVKNSDRVVEFSNPGENVNQVPFSDPRAFLVRSPGLIPKWVQVHYLGASSARAKSFKKKMEDSSIFSCSFLAQVTVKQAYNLRIFCYNRK